jgi:predicted esterase
VTGPHEGQPVIREGASLAGASAALVAVHGRGATAESILQLGRAIAPANMALFGLQAKGNTWYPHSFMAQLGQNEPGLSSGLTAISNLLAHLDENGLLPDRVVLMGFSQGACLVLEYAARHATRFGGVIGFSGGLIGPAGTPRNYRGSLEETPILIGCSDVDFHIPLERVKESTRVLTELGAVVDERIYPGMGHNVNDDEVKAARLLLSQL